MTYLFQIPTFGVAGGVVRQKAKHKQQNEEGYNNVNNNFESFHPDISRGIKNKCIDSMDSIQKLYGFLSYKNAVSLLGRISLLARYQSGKVTE
jgi:hypothetical protein